MIETLEAFEQWLHDEQCFIRDKSAKLVTLRPNLTQRIILRQAKAQARAGKPIRQRILKARKHGVTTLWQSAFWFICAHIRYQVAIFMAHRDDDTKIIFEAVKRLAEKNQIIKVKGNEPMRFPESESLYWSMTAGGRNPGVGGTPTLLHLSEVALLDVRIKDIIGATTQSVPYEPGTIIVEESTARGHDKFYEGWQAALDDENHPYEALFFPWFFDLGNAIPAYDGFVLNDEESMLIRTAKRVYGMDLTIEQFAWRRMKILDIGDNLFRQEFPATPEEAIRSHRGLVLPGMESCVVNSIPYDIPSIGASERVGGFDYGFSDPSALGSAIYKDQHLYVFRIWRGSGKLSNEFAGEVVDNHTYYCDPANPGPTAQLRKDAHDAGRRGCRFYSAPRAKGTGGHGIVKQEWEAVRRLMSDGRLHILEECSRQLLKEAATLAYSKTSGEPDKTRTDECGHFDVMDMLRYMVMGAVVNKSAVIKRKPSKPSIRQQLRM